MAQIVCQLDDLTLAIRIDVCGSFVRIDLAFAHKRKDILMEEIPVSDLSELVNVQLKDSGIRQNFNLIIIAIKKPDGGMLFNPSFETDIMPGDTLIAVGEEENLQKLEKILDPSSG